MEIGEGYSVTEVNYDREYVKVATEFDTFTIYKTLNMWGWVNNSYRMVRSFHPIEYLKFMWDNMSYFGFYEPFLKHYQKTQIVVFAREYIYGATAARPDIAFYAVVDGRLKSYINPQTTEELC